MKQAIKAAWKLTVPIMAGYLFLGITFGFLMKDAGFPFWCPVVMSVIIYSGALEFAAIPLLGAAFDPAGAFVMGLMISARHLFYGIPMLKKYENTGALKPFLIFALTDETFSVSSATEPPEGVERKRFYAAVSFLDHFYWIFGSAVGWLFGTLISFDVGGIDFALTALFIVLFIEQLTTKDGKVGGLIGFAATALALILFGAERMVLFAMLFILSALLLMKGVLSRE